MSPDVLHWLLVQQRIQYRVVCLSGLSVPTWPCTCLPYRSVSGARGSRPLRSERGVMVVPFVRIYSDYAEPRILCWGPYTPIGFGMISIMFHGLGLPIHF